MNEKTSPLLRQAATQFESWWTNRNDQPLLFYQYPEKRISWDRFRKPWLPEPVDASWVATSRAFELARQDGDVSRFDTVLELAAAQADALGFLGAGFPRYFPNLGPGCLAAFVSGYSRLQGDNIWFELGIDRPEIPLADLVQDDEFAGQKHAVLVGDLLHRAARRLEGKMLLSMTDLGGNLDLLAAWRGSTNMVFDMVDQPELVQRVLERADRLWQHWFTAFDAILAPASGGLHGYWMQLISEKPFCCLQCDFAAMLSAEMFRDIVSPSLVRTSKFVGRAVFHLDGPRMQQHLDAICAIPEIHAVQWTAGAGNPGVEDAQWDALYRRIIDHGRKVVLLCYPPNPDALKRLFSKLPSREFYIHVEGPDRISGERLLNLR